LKRQPIKTGILSQIFNACPDLQHPAHVLHCQDSRQVGYLVLFFASNKSQKKKGSTVDQKHMTRAISNSATRSISNTFLVPSDAALFDLTKTTAKPTHTLL